MTNEQILFWAATTNYAQFNIAPSCVIRYGQEQWEKRLQELTPDERIALVTRINRQQVRLRRELAARCNNVSPQSIQRLAKQDSTPASRQAAVWLSNGQ